MSLELLATAAAVWILASIPAGIVIGYAIGWGAEADKKP